MGHMQKSGDYVAIEFHSTDASSAAAITIKDANGVTRTLAANERLLIDSLEGNAVLAASDPSTDITITLFGDYNANSSVDVGERIWVFQGSAVFDGGVEGYSVRTGFTPKVIASTSGLVDINGVGRIVIGQTQGLRPTWKESLIGGLGGYLNITKP